ncbi:hypothetical protein [Mycoplasma parvum]|uniref:Uncharacterized protein n=1 Tax=Mycoplasma parvum str. Indiana TaxID=1403316 RepID=U5NBU6_9MOLU|nr:hypothetical protein [Mycoplasma parvum]AGX89041.1 hypothetical protein PRV_01405 [Mycoplasma parvum str. Indiana]
MFNLIPIKPQQNKNLVESSSEMKLNWNSENYFKPQVLDIKEINNKINNLKNVELKNNSDFQKGGFYVLKVDKNKIPSIRVNTQIELSETPKERIRFPEQKYHQKIATLKVKAPLVGDILQKVPFKFDVSYPSSMLLVKKINHDSSLVKTSGEKNSSNNKEKIYSYFLKNNNKTNQDLNLQKVGVLGIWEFPDFLTSSKSSTSDLSGLDLRFAKKVDYANLKGNSHNNNSSWLDIILGKEKNKEGYYLIRTDNSYWNYKIKDKINLFRVERKENQENQTNSEDASKQEENLTNFEIVSGVISQIPLSRTCSLKKFTIQDELKNPIIIWEKIQNKVSTKGTIDPEEKFCEENNENISPSTMILMGYNLKNNKITK